MYTKNGRVKEKLFLKIGASMSFLYLLHTSLQKSFPQMHPLLYV